MAEDESGFTFVDKRRTQESSAAEEPVSTAPPSQTADAVSEDDLIAEIGDDDQIGSPDIYNVLGYCVSILSAEAWQKMGLIADPKTGEAQPDLAQAKVAVDAAGDLIARLEAAPAEFVPDALRRDLRSLLNDLRLNYVAQRDQAATIIS